MLWIEIAMLIGGISCLSSGRYPLLGGRVCKGAGARIAGLILALADRLLYIEIAR